ncbi:hypothetical protein PMAYCL1PPCAC_29978 [Pristionchus mayeri]|uniref:Secreted protein n=1 Tax=Pristionchus mayeri TaxID=1317129 RepID=A0AAN5DAZ9_9BILA|nr:hypothetical protein PMAYCL1PPCAC_29978 [Pristionchus mayeri]
MNLFILLSVSFMVTAEVRIGPGNAEFQAQYEVAKMFYDPGPIECLIKNAEDTEFTVKLCGMNGASLRSTPNRRQIANYPACMIYKTPKGNMHTCFDLPGVCLDAASTTVRSRSTTMRSPIAAALPLSAME